MPYNILIGMAAPFHAQLGYSMCHMAIMQFEKRNFRGIELDVVTGHPQHSLLFLGTQVAGVAGLQSPKYAVRDYLHRSASAREKAGIQIRDCMGKVGNLPTLSEEAVRAVLTYPRWRDT